MEARKAKLGLFILFLTAFPPWISALDCSRTFGFLLPFSQNSQKTTCFIYGARKNSEYDFPLTTNRSNYTSIEFQGAVVETLPSIIFSKFPNVQNFDLMMAGMKTLPPEPFKVASNLKNLILMGNHLTVLEDRVFFGAEKLEEIDISHNDLVEIKPNVFTSLKELKSLSLEHNKIKSLPPGIFLSLANLAKLYLHHNNIASLDRNMFSACSALTHLNMAENLIGSLDLTFAGPIISLDVSRNNIREMQMRASPLFRASCDQLSEIRASENAIKSVTIDRSLPVSILRLNENRLSDARNVSNVNCLRNLDLSENPLALTTRTFAPMEDLERLRLDALDATYIENGTFAQFRKLQILELSNNKFQAFDLRNLSGLYELEELDLSFNRLVELQSTGVADIVPSLNVIYLGKNEFNCSYWKNKQTELKEQGIKYQYVKSLIVRLSTRSQDIECKNIAELESSTESLVEQRVTALAAANNDLTSGILEEIRHLKSLNIAFFVLFFGLIVLSAAGYVYFKRNPRHINHSYSFSDLEGNRVENPLIGA